MNPPIEHLGDRAPDPDPRPTDALGLEPELMRELGHWVVDRVVDHVAGLPGEPAMRTGGPQELLSTLGGGLPEAPGDPRAALELLADVALGHMQHQDHPRYFARVPGPSSFSGVLGDWLGTGFNAIATSWAGGSGPTAIELVAVDWLAELLGLEPGIEGILLSGGSIGNLTALVAARHNRGPGVAYLSDQAHASIGRALSAIGWASDDIRTIATDARQRMSLPALHAAIGEDRERGRTPRIVIASAGTTNTGAVDPLDGLAHLCATNDLWLHVDGAYGAPAAMCPEGREALVGLDKADSLVVDPHKWLYSPIDCGCLFVRRPGVLEAAFSMDPEYLRDVRAASGGQVELRHRTLELTRRARGLKIWLTLRIHGAARLRAATGRGIALARRAEELVRADDRWELVTPAALGIVTFALRGAGASEHAARAAAVAADGYAAVTSTAVGGRSVLRLCTINPRTTEADIAQTLERLAAG